MQITKYGLRHKITKQLITFSTQGQSEYEFCVSVKHTFELEPYYPIWLIDTRKEAEEAIAKSPEWYSADYHRPEHGYGIKKENLEVVKISLTIEEM